MYWFDIGALVFLLSIVIHSALRGFFKEAAVLAAWAGGYFGSVALQPTVAMLFKPFLKTGVMASLASFFLAFILIYIAVRFAGVIVIRKIGDKTLPAPLNHSAGAVIGGIKWVFFLAILLSPLNLFPDTKSKLMDRSLTAESVINLTKRVTAALGAEVKDIPKELKEGLKEASEAAIKSVKRGGKGIAESLKKISPADAVEELTEDDRKQMDKLIKKLD